MNKLSGDNSVNTRVTEADVIVVGAGMVGLTAALAVAQLGLKVVVLEGRCATLLALPERLAKRIQKSDCESYDNRVSALTRASQNVLSNLGVWQKITHLRAQAYYDMKVWDAQGSGSIDFSSREIYQENLGHIVENSVVVAALIARCKECDIRIQCDTQVRGISSLQEDPAGYSQQLHCQRTGGSEADYCAKLVIGADGALSKVRALANIELYQRDYGHHAVVATVQTSKPNQQTAWQCFTDDGPLAFLPLSDPHLSSIVWSTSAEHAKQLIEMSENEFMSALSRQFEMKLGAVSQVSGRAVFPLSQRHANQYVQSGIALIGDAAHTIHPLAGQGVNLGLLDAAALTQVLKVAVKRRESIAELRVLKRYQRMRVFENTKMSAAMQGFKWLFDDDQTAFSPLRTIARNAGMKLFNQTAPLKQHVITQAMGISEQLPELAQAKA